MKKTNTLTLFIFFLLTLQFFFWNGIRSGFESSAKVEWKGTRSIKPELEVVPAAPSKEMLKAFSFGDEQLTFRYNGYIMQFLGDTFGRVTPLKDYNFERLYRWWVLLDEVDSDSNLIAYIVAYYYGSTQDSAGDIPYVVDFLELHSDKHPSENWWWYSQAIYYAKHKLNDTDRALRIAKKLAELPKDLDIPIWTRQLQAFIYEGRGEYKQACDIAVNVIRDYGAGKLDQGEINFMFDFIKERLRKLIEKESTIAKADISDACRELMEVQKANDLREKASRP